MTAVSIYRATRTNGKNGAARKVAKAGNWRMKWRDPSGKVHTENTGTRLRDAAKQIARKKEYDLSLDPWGLSVRKITNKAWAEFVAEFLAAKSGTRRDRTGEAYKMSLLPVADLMKPRYVSDMATVPAIQRFAVLRAKDVAPATTNKDLRALRAALRWAEQQGYIAKAPAFVDCWVKADKKDPVCLAADVQQKLMDAVDHKDFTPKHVSRDWWKVFVLLCRETGARRGELLGLEWNRVNFAAKSIKLAAETSKGRKDRTLHLPGADDLWALLVEWRKHTEGDLVLPWPIKSIRGFAHDWALLREVAKVDASIVPKNLRSTVGSEMVSAGVSTVAIRDWLGHSSVTTTEKFYCNTGAAMKTAAEQREKWRKQG